MAYVKILSKLFLGEHSSNFSTLVNDATPYHLKTNRYLKKLGIIMQKYKYVNVNLLLMLKTYLSNVDARE